MNYSSILRVIGHTLEPLRPETYEVVSYGNCYLVRCRVKEDSQDKKAEEKRLEDWERFCGYGGSKKLRVWMRSPTRPLQ